MNGYKFALSITDPNGYPTCMGIYNDMETAYLSVCKDKAISMVDVTSHDKTYREGLLRVEGKDCKWCIVAVKPSDGVTPIFRS